MSGDPRALLRGRDVRAALAGEQPIERPAAAPHASWCMSQFPSPSGFGCDCRPAPRVTDTRRAASASRRRGPRLLLVAVICWLLALACFYRLVTA